MTDEARSESAVFKNLPLWEFFETGLLARSEAMRMSSLRAACARSCPAWTVL